MSYLSRVLHLAIVKQERKIAFLKGFFLGVLVSIGIIVLNKFILL